MKTIVTMYSDTPEGTEREFVDVHQVSETSHFVVIVSNVNGKTTETMIPPREIQEIASFHDEDVVAEYARVRAEIEEKARAEEAARLMRTSSLVVA